MKIRNSTTTLQAAFAGLLVFTAAPAFAYDFALGSSGADGALNVTVDQVVALPANGVLNYTTVNIAAGATLSFSYSGTYHPGVALLATGDVVINGTIDISGDDGTASAPGAAGPGGGRGGSGVATASSNSFYGFHVESWSSPMAIRPLGGNGGDGLRVSSGNCTSAVPGGGGGGGALLIVSNTAIRSSAAALIDATGGSAGPKGSLTGCTAFSGYPSAGNAGRVWLMAPTIDAQTLNVSAQAARTNSFELLGLPTASSGMQSAQELVPFPSSLPTAVITAIDGTAVTPATMYILPAKSGSIEATVLATGCHGRNVTATIYAHNASYPNGPYSASLGSAATGSDSINVPVTLAQADGLAYALYTRVTCAAP